MVRKNKINRASGTTKHLKDFPSVILSLPSYNPSILSKNAIALITGGSSGLGFELKRIFPEELIKLLWQIFNHFLLLLR